MKEIINEWKKYVIKELAENDLQSPSLEVAFAALGEIGGKQNRSKEIFNYIVNLTQRKQIGTLEDSENLKVIVSMINLQKSNPEYFSQIEKIGRAVYQKLGNI